jgi:hypothetical protein
LLSLPLQLRTTAAMLGMLLLLLLLRWVSLLLQHLQDRDLPA